MTAAVAARMSLTVRTITSHADFVELEEGWDDLVRAHRRPSPFLLHGWLEAWIRHHVPEGGLRVHVAEQDGRLVGAVPAFVHRRHGLRVTEFLGRDQAALADLLLAADAGPEVGRRLGEALARTDHDHVDLFGLSGGSNLAAALPAGALELIERVEAPVLDLSPGFDAVYAAKTSSKRRNLHRRRVRQLAELGAVEFRLARTEEELLAAIEDAFALHRLRWSGRPDGSGFATEVGMRFNREAVAALARLDVPRILTLSVGGRPVAFSYFLLFEGTMYGHRLAFHPDVQRLSAGVVTTLEAIRLAAEEGVTRVEYLGGDERYKLDLADGLEPMHQGLGLAGTPQGRAAVAARRGVIAARKRLKRSPALRRLYLEGLAPTRRLAARLSRRSSG